MFKKTLTAVALLGALSSGAMAASVTLYGVANLGMNYKAEKTTGTPSTSVFKMTSGDYAGSRFGLKGVEELGNGMTVGFQLENGFSADTGALKGEDGRLFDRQATVSLTGDFGTIAAGRMGALSSGNTSFSTIWNNASMSTGWGSTAASMGLYSALSDRDTMDNTVIYMTPDFDGFKVSAQYSFNVGGNKDAQGKPMDEKDGTRENNRYAGLGLDYTAGAFTAGLVVDTQMKAHTLGTESKDSIGVTLGTSYDFEVVKLFALGQYGKHEAKVGDLTASNTDIGAKAWSTAIGLSAPVAGGTVYAQYNYLDGKDKLATKTSKTIKAQGLAAGYDYSLSKRTTVYTFAGIGKTKLEATKTKRAECGFGIAHTF